MSLFSVKPPAGHTVTVRPHDRGVLLTVDDVDVQLTHSDVGQLASALLRARKRARVAE